MAFGSNLSCNFLSLDIFTIQSQQLVKVDVFLKVMLYADDKTYSLAPLCEKGITIKCMSCYKKNVAIRL